MKSQMLNRRFKKATVLVSRPTLERAIQEGQALAEKLLQTNPNDPSLDQVEQAVARLQSVSQMEPLEDYLDDAKQRGTAESIKRDVDMIAEKRQAARGGVGAQAEVLPVQGGAGSSDPAWTTDRDENGKPKTPQQVEVPRLAAKKKEAEPVAPAPVPATGNVIDYIPTEDLLKVIANLPKDEDFAQNTGKQDALKQLIDVLKARPIVPAEPAEGAAPVAAPAPAAPVVASKNAKSEPFGGKQAPPFGKKDEAKTDDKEKDDKKESSAKKADGQIYEAHPAAPASKEEFVSDIPQSQGTAVLAGWEGTLKLMAKVINNPENLARNMKAAGYTAHKASFILRKRGAKYLVEKFGGTSPTQWTDDGKKGDVLEGNIKEVTEARGMKDEAPAKLDRPATTDMAKLASAVKDAESYGEKLKALYLDAKPILTENSTAPVRNFVESIYKAYSLCDDAVKTLNKQEMQEKAEAEAAEIKKQNKKSSLLGLSVADAE